MAKNKKAVTNSDTNVKVWKYTLEDENKEPVTTATFDIPKGASFLSARPQDGKVVLYFLIDESRATEQRRFTVVGTGRALPAGSVSFRETLKLMGENMVGHLFEHDEVEQSEEERRVASNDRNPC